MFGDDDNHCPHCHDGMGTIIGSLINMGTRASGQCSECGGSGELGILSPMNADPRDKQCKNCGGTGDCPECYGTGLL